ncbi:hypothetical protein I302_103468 [Kwoniella bestiolae CBS 10118]|uniref:NADP-dependent oxidoreductase domain-containing protein n=1 Tax=Kwoniella bestiolae CBS 10118 TaxID=1296100 RepID=A0A1B9G8H3_9TREE|nr:hypothetical protein I302_02169 [Kwoniella bestiolae CBS 10118]OCF27328.1 hypothetical protein I302_02169 [Kwoniella bestiolae CBS 10118]
MTNNSSVAQTVTLNSGNKVPILAFGTAAPFLGKDCSNAILQALRAGFWHIDTAQLYGNQEYVGKALSLWEGKREEVYITAKWGLDGGEKNDPRKALEETLSKMGVEYIDMFLMHSPITISPLSIAEAWSIMETLQEEGKCIDIGISNFGATDIRELCKTWKVIPAINQIEFSPYNAHDPLSKACVKACEEHGIAVSGFGCLQPLSLSDPPLPLNPILHKLCGEKGSTPGQVLLRWAQQEMSGTVVTTTSQPHRMHEDVEAFDRPLLTDEEMEEIRKVGEGRYYRRYLDPFRP